MSIKNTNFNPAEIAKFSEHAHHWWDPNGLLKTLHDINPLRIDYIKKNVNLINASALDIGCGGGILSESLSREGAIVTGIDMSAEALKTAELHQKESGTTVEYIHTTAEVFALEGKQYDVITCLELLEHVPDPAGLIKAASQMLAPKGRLFISTLNRNIKSYLFAIVGAEYILKMLPKNTHDFAQFIRPSELRALASDANLHVLDIIGISYNIFTREYKLSPDISVNYIMQLGPAHG